jgi:hypothetical protein
MTEKLNEIMKIIMSHMKMAEVRKIVDKGTVDFMKKVHPEWFDLSEIEIDGKPQ